jgi:penicillin-binding protein 1C
VPPQAPSSVIKQTVDWTDAMGKNLEAQREEWFIKGTEQIHFVLNQAKGSQPRITSPTQGTILALDPDIPPKSQRLTFKAEHVGENQTLAWTLNGKTLAQGTTATWLPSPGVHQITLTDGQGAELDSVKLEVRGAALMSAPSQP